MLAKENIGGRLWFGEDGRGPTQPQLVPYKPSLPKSTSIILSVTHPVGNRWHWFRLVLLLFTRAIYFPTGHLRYPQIRRQDMGQCLAGCGVPVVFVQEGGYRMDAVGDAAAKVVTSLARKKPSTAAMGSEGVKGKWVCAVKTCLDFRLASLSKGKGPPR